MKTDTKRIIVVSQIPSIIFLMIYLVCKTLLKNGFELFLFENVWLDAVQNISFSIFLIIEFVTVIVLMIKIKKLILIIINIILLPILFLQIFATDFKIDTTNSIKEYSFKEFEKDIIIENRSFLLSGISTIYEKRNNFILKKITSVDGDDGRCPLEDESEFEIKVNNNEITFHYFFDYDRSPEAIKKHTIKYEDGHFVEGKNDE